VSGGRQCLPATTLQPIDGNSYLAWNQSLQFWAQPCFSIYQQEVESHDTNALSQSELDPERPWPNAADLDALHQLDRAAFSAVGSALRSYDRWLLWRSLKALAIEQLPINFSQQGEKGMIADCSRALLRLEFDCFPSARIAFAPGPALPIPNKETRL
jgi:hypothetical protein